MVEGLFAFFDFQVLRFGCCGSFGRYRPPYRCSLEVCFGMELEESHRLGNIHVDFILRY